MSYISKIKNRLIIDDKNCDKFTNLKDVCYGLSPRDYGAAPLGSFATVLPREFYIPSSEWAERIEKLEKTKGQPKDHKELAGFESLNQANTNYCWINAPVQAMHYVRSMQGLKHIPLSPASVGAKIKNFRNVGGWGSEGLKYCAEHGVVPQSLWPANAINRRYDTREADEARKNFKVDEFYELPDRSFHALVSCLLRGWPVAIGLNWWRHEVLACALYIRGSDPESDTVVDIDNSWGGWGDNGHGILTRDKATPDDSVACRVITHTNPNF